jgi:hypothetical protein
MRITSFHDYKCELKYWGKINVVAYELQDAENKQVETYRPAKKFRENKDENT